MYLRLEKVKVQSYTENRGLSWCQPCRHWWQRKLWEHLGTSLTAKFMHYDDSRFSVNESERSYMLTILIITALWKWLLNRHICGRLSQHWIAVLMENASMKVSRTDRVVLKWLMKHLFNKHFQLYKSFTVVRHDRVFFLSVNAIWCSS